MSKQTFICPNCSVTSTYEVERNTFLYPQSTYPNKEHLICRCDACGALTYKIEVINRESQGDFMAPKITIKEEFQYPFGFVNLEQTLPREVKEFYKEAHDSFKIGSFKASAAMCRATISAICDDKRIKEGELKEKIDALPLSERLKKAAKDIKWIGDKTMHNDIDWIRVGWDNKTLQQVFAFIDRIVDDIYIQEREARELGGLVSKAGKLAKKD